MPTPIDFVIDSITASKTARETTNTININNPCVMKPMCYETVKNNDKSLKCSQCLFSIHIRCNGITVTEYKDRIIKKKQNPDIIDNEEWICLECSISERAKIFPFGLESIHDINCINSSNSMKSNTLIPEFEIMSEISKIRNSHDIDVNSSENINCKYYTNEEFPNLTNSGNSFVLIHCNVDGYGTHFENLHQFLVESKQDFNVICISETSQLLGENLTTV